ncbi:unnamed protein product [Ilex paraguariensis]|uniref:Uncharacterized protein n=1 Tax=Ilex paraguariensis TaxID=185542 RepID=A0ABC8U2Z1_9AQUA
MERIDVAAPFYDLFDPFQASSASASDPKNLNLLSPRPFAFDSTTKEAMHGFQSGGHLNFSSENLIPTMDDESHTHQPLNFREFISMNVNSPDDQLSCVTAENGHSKADPKLKKTVQTKRSSNCQKKSNVVKGQWTREEDRVLVRLVEEYGVKRWSHIAPMLPGRVGKQCRERWHNHLRPDIKKETWSEEEDKILIEVHKQMGNKWAKIARSLPGRTENTIKNHWNATLRRQFSSPKSHNPKCDTLLQNYIKTLIQSPGETENPCPDSPSREIDTLINPQLQLGSSSFEFELEPKHQLLQSDDDETDETINFSFGAKVFPQGGYSVKRPLELDTPVQFDERKEMDFLEMLTHGIF